MQLGNVAPAVKTPGFARTHRGKNQTMFPMDILGLVVEPAAMLRIQAQLSGSATTIGDSQPNDMLSGDFGSAPTALNLATHASAAQSALSEALTAMAKGLEGHVEALLEFRQRTGDVDEASAVYMQQLRINSENVTRDFGGGDR